MGAASGEISVACVHVIAGTSTADMPRFAWRTFRAVLAVALDSWAACGPELSKGPSSYSSLPTLCAIAGRPRRGVPPLAADQRGAWLSVPGLIAPALEGAAGDRETDL